MWITKKIKETQGPKSINWHWGRLDVQCFNNPKDYQLKWFKNPHGNMRQGLETTKRQRTEQQPLHYLTRRQELQRTTPTMKERVRKILSSNILCQQRNKMSQHQYKICFKKRFAPWPVWLGWVSSNARRGRWLIPSQGTCSGLALHPL